MKSSLKGASEKRRLTQYVTNTILNDNYKGTTEQFVLHFSEQLRQLEEISDPAEHFPSQIKLQEFQYYTQKLYLPVCNHPRRMNNSDWGQ